MTNLKPFKFEPYLKSVLWGGEKIAKYKGIVTDQHNIGESWEISGVDGHESVVAEGDDKGLNLRQIIEKYKGDLVGNAVYAKYGDTFPLLVKIIDAKGDLSVQVHPDDTLAKARHNSYGKTEMWYIIDAEEGAPIYAGLSKQITPEEYEKLVAENAIMDVIARHDSHAGDLFFLPAGRIHAIGAGALVAEIQENSNLTYRLYDYDRVDKYGNKRPLHVEKALKTANLKSSAEPRQPLRVLKYRQGVASELLCRCKYFEVYRMLVNTERRQRVYYRADSLSFRVLLCIGGCGVMMFSDQVLPICKGDCVFVPADSEEIRLHGVMQFLDIRG